MPPPDRSSPIATIEGIPELRRDLREISRESRNALDKELRKAGQKIAADAKLEYRKFHPRRRAGKGSQRGIRAGISRGQPVVFLGSEKYPYLQGQEWGATGNSFPQFPRAVRLLQGSEGRFFWPAVVDGADDAYEKIVAAIDKATRRAFPGGR